MDQGTGTCKNAKSLPTGLAKVPTLYRIAVGTLSLGGVKRKVALDNIL